MEDKVEQIEGIIVDEPVRIDSGGGNKFFYGWIKGFSGNQYIVNMNHCPPEHRRPMSPQYCKVPDDIELLLYF